MLDAEEHMRHTRHVGWHVSQGGRAIMLKQTIVGIKGGHLRGLLRYAIDPFYHSSSLPEPTSVPMSSSAVVTGSIDSTMDKPIEDNTAQADHRRYLA